MPSDQTSHTIVFIILHQLQINPCHHPCRHHRCLIWPSRREKETEKKRERRNITGTYDSWTLVSVHCVGLGVLALLRHAVNAKGNVQRTANQHAILHEPLLHSSLNRTPLVPISTSQSVWQFVLRVEPHHPFFDLIQTAATKKEPTSFWPPFKFGSLSQKLVGMAVDLKVDL